MSVSQRDDSADTVRATACDVADWLARLEFPRSVPTGESEPARAMRDDLRVNFYEDVQHWLGDLRERLRRTAQECGSEPPLAQEHVAETMARIIDAAREVAVSDAPDPPDAQTETAGDAREEPAPDPAEEAEDELGSGDAGEVGETVACFRARLQAERRRLADRAREQRVAALDRLRRGPATPSAEPAADAAPVPEERAACEAPSRVAPEAPTGDVAELVRDGIRFRRVDRASGASTFPPTQ